MVRCYCYLRLEGIAVDDRFTKCCRKYNIYNTRFILIYYNHYTGYVGVCRWMRKIYRVSRVCGYCNIYNILYMK